MRFCRPARSPLLIVALIVALWSQGCGSDAGQLQKCEALASQHTKEADDCVKRLEEKKGDFEQVEEEERSCNETLSGPTMQLKVMIKQVKERSKDEEDKRSEAKASVAGEIAETRKALEQDGVKDTGTIAELTRQVDMLKEELSSQYKGDERKEKTYKLDLVSREKDDFGKDIVALKKKIVDNTNAIKEEDERLSELTRLLITVTSMNREIMGRLLKTTVTWQQLQDEMHVEKELEKAERVAAHLGQRMEDLGLNWLGGSALQKEYKQEQQELEEWGEKEGKKGNGSKAEAAENAGDDVPDDDDDPAADSELASVASRSRMMAEGMQQTQTVTTTETETVTKEKTTQVRQTLEQQAQQGEQEVQEVDATGKGAAQEAEELAESAKEEEGEQEEQEESKSAPEESKSAPEEKDGSGKGEKKEESEESEEREEQEKQEAEEEESTPVAKEKSGSGEDEKKEESQSVSEEKSDSETPDKDEKEEESKPTAKNNSDSSTDSGADKAEKILAALGIDKNGAELKKTPGGGKVAAGNDSKVGDDVDVVGEVQERSVNNSDGSDNHSHGNVDAGDQSKIVSNSPKVVLFSPKIEFEASPEAKAPKAKDSTKSRDEESGDEEDASSFLERPPSRHLVPQSGQSADDLPDSNARVARRHRTVGG